ncbi:MAG: hypothetical protein LC134_08145 [Chitinophagales bacterium]|nr:hypothetical protein [Chitinophagales bacterium]
MKKHFLTLIITLLLCSTATQAQNWQWGIRGGNPFNSSITETIIDMATDAHGNIYALAEIDGGGGTTIQNQTINTHGGNRDILVFSYNCNGQLRWVKCIGTPTSSDVAIAIAVDGQNKVYVTGKLHNFSPITQYFDTDTIQPNPLKTRFLIQYDSSGNYQWLRQYGSDTISYLNQDYYSAVRSNDMVGDPAGGNMLVIYRRLTGR